MRKILFASDLHASTMCFRKLVRLALDQRVDAVLVGGDLTGKSLHPLVSQPGGRFLVELHGEQLIVDGGSGLQAVERDLEDRGAYTARMDEEEHEYLRGDRAASTARFAKAMRQRLVEWLSHAQRHLQPAGIRFLTIMGNDDAWELDSVFDEFPFVENPERATVSLDTLHEVIGESAANETPFFDCPRNMPEDDIRQRLEKRVATLRDPGRAVFLVHTPPFNSGLDNAWKLDARKQVMTRGGVALTEPVGSEAVRAVLENVQPCLSLHGHIHESPDRVTIGRTVALNPGSEYSQGILRAFLVTLDRDGPIGEYPLFL